MRSYLNFLCVSKILFRDKGETAKRGETNQTIISIETRNKYGAAVQRCVGNNLIVAMII